MTYDAFVSYSHAADGQLVVNIQRLLSRLAKPWYRRRGLRIFRDKTTLSATPHLWPAIASALDRSSFFILMASPEAAKSPWVQQEIDYWLSRPTPPGSSPPADRLLIVLTDGSIIWSARENDFDWERTSALPSRLRQAFRTEPLYVDLTNLERVPDERRILDAVAMLVGAIRGVPPDEIIGEDLRQHRKLKRAGISVVTALALLTAAAGYFWHRDRERRLWDEHRDLAERVLPQRAGQLDRVRDRPIRDIRISLDPAPLLGDEQIILELQLDLNPLFTQPMSFFFAPFREGATWPEGFPFAEMPYTRLHRGQARIDAKLAWFDRLEDLSQTVDGTDTGDLTPTFIFAFDGQQFTPGGPGLHLPQKFEIPPLQKLLDDRDSFRLITHHPARKVAREVDLQATSLDVVVTVSFPEEGHASMVLFDSRHTPEEQAILDGDYLRNRPRIEREAILNLYPALSDRARRVREEERRRARRLLESGVAGSDADRQLLARMTDQQARLLAFRGQYEDALSRFMKVIDLLEPLVLERIPAYEDAELLYHASKEPAAHFVYSGNYQEATGHVDRLLSLTTRLREAEPREPNYRRWQAMALLRKAEVSAGLGARDSAAAHLARNVEALHELHEELGNPASSRDLKDALERGLEYASAWGVSEALPLKEWREEMTARSRQVDQR